MPNIVWDYAMAREDNLIEVPFFVVPDIATTRLTQISKGVFKLDHLRNIPPSYLVFHGVTGDILINYNSKINLKFIVDECIIRNDYYHVEHKKKTETYKIQCLTGAQNLLIRATSVKYFVTDDHVYDEE